MAGFSTEAKVGVFVMIGVAVLVYMTIRLGSFQFGEPPGYSIWAVFDQATGLRKDSPVERAGIPIGKVARIQLYEGRAKVSMLIYKGISLPADCQAYIRTRGVLGDKYVSIEKGSPQAPMLKENSRLTQAVVPTDLDRVMGRVGQIADDVKDITSALRISLASKESQLAISESLANIRELTAALKVVVAENQKRLSNVIVNLDGFTSDLASLSRANKMALSETIRNFRTVSGQMERTIVALTSVIQKIDRGQGSVGALINERGTVDDLNATLQSLKQVVAKINQGKGTIGRLINDDTTITKIDEAVTSINDYLTRADAWRTAVEYRGEYLFGESALRNVFNVRLQPKADKFYLIGLVTDPVGKRTEKWTTTTTWQDGVRTDTTTRNVTVDKDDLKFNAQFGKRFYNVTARAGLFQSAGGFGLDYHMLDDRLTLTLEAFDFRQDENPHIKVAMDYSFWRYFYVTAGWDDVFSENDHATVFLGGGVRFWDDDLKFLLTNAPTP